MANSYFRFKQFIVRQDKTSMKVGTDGVLLGAWANISGAESILDIGSGTGLIALMLAQRSNAQIDAVELDEASHLQSTENINRSPWSNRIKPKCESFQNYAKTCDTNYDLVVSNPPYFINSLKPPESGRSIARHADLLPHSELLEGVITSLKPTGRFCTILPYIEGNIFIANAASRKLYCSKKLNVTSNPVGNVKRILLEFCFTRQPLEEGTMAIYGHNGEHSPEYVELTKDFYLAF